MVSDTSIASELPNLAPRHRPVTAAYMNDELVGASCSVPGDVCLITLLSHRQTGSEDVGNTVVVLDTLSTVRDRPGFNAHCSSNNNRAPSRPVEEANRSSPLEDDLLCTSTSTTTNTFPQPSGPPVAFGPPCSSQAATTATGSSVPTNAGLDFHFWDEHVPPEWGGTDRVAGSCDGARQHGGMDPWDPWNEEDTSTTTAGNAPGDVHPISQQIPFCPPLPVSNPTPLLRFPAVPLHLVREEAPPPGQHFSPWNVWDEAEEKAWRAIHRQRQAAVVVNAPTTCQPSACVPATNPPATHSAAGVSLPPFQNPAMPPGWPTCPSFADDCGLLQTLDPRVCPNSFTLFDVALQVRLIPKPRDAGEIELRDIARQHCQHLTPPVHIHRLADEVPGFPRPQFTASAGELPRMAFATPIDLRPSGWGVCVALAHIGTSTFALANAAQTVCPVANFGRKIARHTLVASSAGRDLDPYEPLPVDVDHVRIRRTGIHASAYDTGGVNYNHVPSSHPHSESDVDAILGHIDAEGHFDVAIHAPGCPDTTIVAHLHDSPHVLVRRASQHLSPYRPHTTVQACWPIEQPRSHLHLLHLLLEFDGPRSEDTTMFLVDCRGVEAFEGDYVAFTEKRDLTAGELFAILRDKISCRLPPAGVLVNGRPLHGLAVRRYSSPLIRLLSREQCDARDVDPDAFCPASWSTHYILGFIPGFSALTDTYEAFLRRHFGASQRGRVRRSTTVSTTTTAAQLWEPSAQGQTTTTTSTTVGPTVYGHPFQPLEALPICLHMLSAEGDAFTTTVAGTSQVEQLLHRLCRSMHKHRRLQARDEIAIYNQVLVTSKEVRLFLHAQRPQTADRCWVFAPQWLDAPVQMRCQDLSRADFFEQIGIPDRPMHQVSVRGVICQRAVHIGHGDVVIVESPSFFVHRAPMMSLIPRIPDIQALLFRHLGPSQEVLDEPHLHLAFWRSAVQHCQSLFGLHERGALTTLVSADIPSMVVCLGTRTFPTAAQVQHFYDERLAGKFGRRHFRDTTYMDRGNALMFEPWHDSSKRLWILRFPTGVDARIADLEGEDFRGRHIGFGWCLQPTSVGNGFGFACATQLLSHDGIPRPTICPDTPHESDDSEAEILALNSTGPPTDDHFGSVVAQLRRHRGEDARTPPDASRGLPSNLAAANCEAENREAVRAVFDNFEGTFPLLVDILETQPTIDSASPDDQAADNADGTDETQTARLGAASEASESEGGVSLLQTACRKVVHKVENVDRQDPPATNIAVGETIPPVPLIRAIATPCRNRLCLPGPPLSQARVAKDTVSIKLLQIQRVLYAHSSSMNCSHPPRGPTRMQSCVPKPNLKISCGSWSRLS